MIIIERFFLNDDYFYLREAYMKRDDILKDIEQKLRTLGYSDEKDLEILKKYYFQILQEGAKPNNIKISEDECEKLLEIYKKE